MVGLPAEKKEGLSTTIMQQAGSILLEVEKRNVKHFEVETPYLAAVVKGTQFRVTVNATGTSVDVIRGQVEVADFKSGQIAQVMPGQHATAFAHGNAGLSLGGSGTFSPIEQGKPRASSVDRVPVPRNGLTAPPASPASALRLHAAPQQRPAAPAPRHGVTRISSSLGEVRLNFHKVTHGLARRQTPRPARATREQRTTDTVWGSGDSAARQPTARAAVSGNASSGGSASSGNSGSRSAATAVGSGNGGGNGNGSNGDGNGKRRR